MGSHRRRTAAVASLVVVAAGAIAAVALSSGPPTRTDAATGVPAGYTTATVRRRTLTESSTVNGTLGYGATFEVYDRLAGTFTWLPSVGAMIARGGTLFRVNNLPVVLMYGSVPAYRTLNESVSDGPDVAELNRNLIDLGYDPYGAIADVERFGEATAAAVRRWQKVEGLTQTGEVQLGRVVFAPSARRVTSVHVALGQDPPAVGGEPKGGAKQSKEGHPKKEEGKPKKEEPGGGGGAGAPELVLTTTSTQQLVQLKLKAERQQLAHVGERAPVLLPGSDVVRGRIIEVGTVASEAKGSEGEKGPGGGGGGSSGEGGGESATIPVTLALTRNVPRLDEAPVSVELVKSVSRDVLAVPATALTAAAGGRYAIETLEGNRRVQLAVTPGMFANGYVQVEGSGLHEGQTVIESE